MAEDTDPAGEGERVDPDELYVLMLSLLESQGSKYVEPLLREHHHSRGNRLFTLVTLGSVLPGFDQVLAHSETLENYFESHPNLTRLTFLIARARADFEIALEALLVGRQSVVADSMRDVMEIELLLRDFTARPGHLDTWLTTDDRERWKRFAPKEVRRRLANDAYPGKGFDLPEADEYAVHSAGLHPSPELHPYREKERDPTMHEGKALLEAGEILEHGTRLFLAVEGLLNVFPSEHDAPPAAAELDLLMASRDHWKSYADEIKERLGMTPRGPRPRSQKDPTLRLRPREDPS